MRLVDYFIPFMAFLRHFQAQPSGDAASVGLQLDSLLMEARRKSQEAGVDNGDVMEGLFAVVAWADEILLATSWAGAQTWTRQLLQRRHFNVSNAGVAFFLRLEGLSQRQMAVREVYLFCLSMGFSGRYGHEGNLKALADIRSDCLDQLVHKGDGLYGDSGKLMFPQAYAQPGQTGATLKRAGRWQISSLAITTIFVPLFVLLLLYGVYHLIIGQTVNAIVVQIQ